MILQSVISSPGREREWTRGGASSSPPRSMKVPHIRRGGISAVDRVKSTAQRWSTAPWSAAVNALNFDCQISQPLQDPEAHFSLSINGGGGAPHQWNPAAIWTITPRCEPHALILCVVCVRVCVGFSFSLLVWSFDGCRALQREGGGAALEEEETRLLPEVRGEMDFREGNGVVGDERKVHSDHHLDIEIPDTAHQISHGLSLISRFLQKFCFFFLWNLWLWLLLSIYCVDFGLFRFVCFWLFLFQFPWIFDVGLSFTVFVYEFGTRKTVNVIMCLGECLCVLLLKEINALWQKWLKQNSELWIVWNSWFCLTFSQKKKNLKKEMFSTSAKVHVHMVVELVVFLNWSILGLFSHLWMQIHGFKWDLF